MIFQVEPQKFLTVTMNRNLLPSINIDCQCANNHSIDTVSCVNMVAMCQTKWGGLWKFSQSHFKNTSFEIEIKKKGLHDPVSRIKVQNTFFHKVLLHDALWSKKNADKALLGIWCFNLKQKTFTVTVKKRRLPFIDRYVWNGERKSVRHRVMLGCFRWAEINTNSESFRHIPHRRCTHMRHMWVRRPSAWYSNFYHHQRRPGWYGFMYPTESMYLET